MMSVQKPKPVRCAIYTNSNLDGGGAADQNAIRVQRKVLNANLAGKRAEGRVRVPDKYEDIGQSGGALTRPGLQRLMADAETGKIDYVLTYDLACVTRSNVDKIRIIKHFRRCGVRIGGTTPFPASINKLMGDCFKRALTCSRDESWRPAEGPPCGIRCAVYMRGNNGSIERQRRAVGKLLHIRLNFAPRVIVAYEDVDLPTAPALKKLLKDVDAGRVDCVVVHTFDRLTGELISHEELLTKLQQRDVTLMAVWPELYHLWGKKMEQKWIACMRWFLRVTEHNVKNVVPRKELVTA